MTMLMSIIVTNVTIIIAMQSTIARMAAQILDGNDYTMVTEMTIIMSQWLPCPDDQPHHYNDPSVGSITTY